MVPFTASSDANAVYTAYRIVQEIATFLRASEEDAELKVFYADLRAYCVIIRGHWGRINKGAVEINRQLHIRLLEQLDYIVAPDVFTTLQVPTLNEKLGGKLRTLSWYWDEARKKNDTIVKLEIIRSCLEFGGTPEARDEFIRSLATSEEEIRKIYPEDPEKWITEDITSRRTIREPPYAVRTAAQSVFNALTACKGCLCNPMHDFSARICLGTYRKPDPGPHANVNEELDFDLFLSMIGEWHEARVHTEREEVVQFVVGDGGSQSRFGKRDRVMKPMKVKRLCEPIAKIKTMAAYRLDFKVIRNQLFKLQSQKSNVLFNTTMNPISLQQILEEGPRSFTERARRILAVILSSSALHFFDTPWLQPIWSSANILFFRTASGTIPLRPFIQTQLSGLEHGHFSNHSSDRTVPVGSNGDETDSDSGGPDDIDPDDLVSHQCPTLISLAVMLMEVYFATPFKILARRYGVEVGNTEFSSCTRHIDTNLVFEACKGEIPEKFLYAIHNCLEPTIWEDLEGNKLAAEILRIRIYEEVVRPLETELIKAYSSISIDDLDRLAQSLDFTSWDQAIQPWNDQVQAVHGTVRTSSPFSRPSTSNQLEYNSPVKSSLQSHLQYHELLGQGHSPPPPRAHSPLRNGLPLTAHTMFKCQSYLDWKSKYQEVYDKYIPAQLGTCCPVPVKIAILDTGLDLTHPDVEARTKNIKGKYNWLQEKFRQSVHDRNGHGTFTANLILDYAPDAELYVAKIAENKPSSPKTVAEAINYAVSEWKVDIISMSFGFPTRDIEGYVDLERALANAYANKVLLFAAASNNGGQLGRSFPARDHTVIAVHATDANGNRSSFRPTAIDDDISIGTIGEAVESA
ncbi:hypothetical protein GQX73_g289 [Xylaria multiplex]|uniref:Uncharacterized protein n=1 Tax=Xylaria multiplex TaxID=323545 RepID=A0A7C8MY34_9PEZI|nr:hypothetical protein GQX73_g289 [Xylaria multiplex]